MFEHLLLVAALIAVVAMFVHARRVKEYNRRLSAEVRHGRSEHVRLSGLLAPMEGVANELVTMLARARAEELVPESVLNDAHAILEGRLPEQSRELQSLRSRLQRQYMSERQLGPVAAEEVQRIERELVSAKANGWPAVLIAEFEYGRHSRLGSMETEDDGSYPEPEDLPVDLQTWSYTGPIKQIVDYLHEQGLQVRVQSELRYTNHPRGGGLGNQVLVLVP